jgi:hypothetical protein
MADNPPENDGAAAAPARENEIAPAEASKLLMGGVGMLQRQWLQNAVNIAKSMTSGQPVSTGNFDDLRRIREQFEDLDRANTALNQIAQAQEKSKEQAEAKNKD